MRTRRLFLLALAGVLLGLLLVLGSVEPASPAASAAPPAQATQEFVQITNNTGDMRLVIPARGPGIPISGNGEKVAYVDAYDEGVNSSGDLYVADVDSDEIQLVDGDALLSGISYDGGKVLYMKPAIALDIRLYISGADVTPCVSDPRIDFDACLRPTLPYPYHAAISGDGRIWIIGTPRQ